MNVPPDGKGPLDHLTRRWICEACVERAMTVPEIAERLRTRGWRGEPGALTTTVSKLERDGYLRCVGQVVKGKRRPSRMFSFERARELTSKWPPSQTPPTMSMLAMR